MEKWSLTNIQKLRMKTLQKSIYTKTKVIGKIVFKILKNAFSGKTPGPGVLGLARAFSLWPGIFGSSARLSSNGHNFLIRAPIEACKVLTRSSFDDEDNGGLRTAFGHHFDRKILV